MVVQQILQDGHPDLFKPCALCNFLSTMRVCDVELVQLSLLPRLNLCSSDIQVQILERTYLQGPRCQIQLSPVRVWIISSKIK